MNKFIVLYGPTGVGKTDIGLQIAGDINAEIVNMDIGQFYKPFSIGTAKPDCKNILIPHHLFDCVDEPINFSVALYKKRVIEIMNALWKKGKTPLLIGGSGFYLYSLLFEIRNEVSKASSEQHFYYQAEEKEKTFLWEKLRAIDKERAEKIHPNDYYRISRALQFYQNTNSLPSVFLPRFKPVAPCDIIFLDRERKDLYDRINRRTAVMFSGGFVDEVKGILGTPWEEFILKKKLIGYNELVFFMRQGNLNLDVVQECVARRTRQYAKRQYTFWRHLEKKLIMNKEENIFDCRMRTVHLTSLCDEDATQEILKYVKNY